MLYPNYVPQQLEPEILKYWETRQTLSKLKKRNAKGKRFSFLQGPPYTSGKVHIGTAWNTVLKDIALRYKRSQGFKVWDRNGYDVHGLPTEHKVTAKFGLKTKEEIEKFGQDRFIKECIKFSLETAGQMTKDFLRLGCTLDYSDSYMALKNEYMEGEWWMVKQAWDKKRLYLGEKVMTWCAHCETALAKHECEYKNLKENSIFLKFPVLGRKKEYLIIWTTTPWTIPFNLAIMVNPDLEYVRAQVENEVWIVGKGLVGPLVSSVANKPFKILDEFRGEKLLGTEYAHPWEKEITSFRKLKKEHPNTHTVILSSQYVDFSAGSGLVHCAPGCGPEDQEVGKQYGLPPFSGLNERGEFLPDVSLKFAGRIAKKDDQKFIDDLDQAGALIATSEVEHDYPTCWRCHLPVIFRTTTQWFFRIEDLKEAMIKENKKVNWVPKTNSFDAWTSNLKDNSITRQRYWGTPVPIWKCSHCENVEVVGSISELKKKSKEVPEDIHRPWIDQVKWDCKCGKGRMQRIPDILDVWIDAGTAAWNCFYYPQRKEELKTYFPADLILEAIEQVRLWFSMLSICSQLAFGKNSYKNVYMHGMLRDINGEKMSKSLGNIISPDELIQKHGADVLRYYMCQTNAGEDINYSWEECATKARYLHILWNIHKLLLNLAEENGLNPYQLSAKNAHLGVEEKYILSKLNSTIREVTELLEQYRLDEGIAPLETLYLELSRTYIQMVRDKSALGSPKEKEACVFTLGRVLLELLKMFQLYAPFICEAIYLNLKEAFDLKEESISHFRWPSCSTKEIDSQLEQDMEIAGAVIQAALNSREKAKLGLRWPVKELVVSSPLKDVSSAVRQLSDIIQTQTNAKKVTVGKLPGVKTSLIPEMGKIGSTYGKLSPEIVKHLAANKEKVLETVEKENYYVFVLAGTKLQITKEMFKIAREVPKQYVESEFKGGLVYLNQERSEELEREGYMREVTRQIQQLRKEAGLQKLDRINLCLESSLDLSGFKKEIAEKVGAKKVSFTAG